MSNFAYAAAGNAANQAAPSQHITTLQAYANNLAHAVRLLWGALLARKPAQVERQLSRRQKLRAVLELNSMAHEVEGSMPSLAAELRYLAANR
ncbi:MAG TPA: hypothetical protein VL051_00770 [Burkholderiaceae bacterium]|nr:hypothetical protein [Burkholderiaceae bacterium]